MKKMYEGTLKYPEMQRVVEEYIGNKIKENCIRDYAKLLEYLRAHFDLAYCYAIDLGEQHFEPLLREQRKKIS